MNKLHERMQKILALAKRGVGGEQQNAQRMLDNMLRKYGMRIEDLEGEEVERYYWNCRDKSERQLLLQIHAKVCDGDGSYWRNARQVGLDLTKSQYVEIDLHYDVLRADLKKAIENTISAFIMANGLYGKAKEDAPDKVYTEQELKDLEAMFRLSKVIVPSEVVKRIN